MVEQPPVRYAVITSQFPETHETFILRELLALRRRGHEITIFSLKPCRDAIVHPEARPLMAETVYAPFVLSWRLWAAQAYWWLRRPLRCASTLADLVWVHRSAPGQLAKLLALWPKLLLFARVIEQRRLPHLHAHWATVPAGAAMVIARLTDVPWSMTAHAWDIFAHNPTLPAKIRRARLVLTCTEYNRRHLTSLAPEAAARIRLAYHGVEISSAAPAVEAEGSRVKGRDFAPVILSVGRLTETKGFPYLLEACHLLKEQGRKFECLIVGEGPSRGALERRIAALGLQQDVRLAGVLPHAEVQRLYREVQVFALPSVVGRNGDRDGIPNVVLEAMAAGLPVVSTRISGIPEAVQHGQTGLLVPERDAVALAEALDGLLQDPARGSRMGAAGRRHAADAFDSARHMDALDAVMRQVVPAPRRVLYVIWSLAVGGAERVVSLLAARLDRSRFTPLVACLNGPGALAPEVQAAGVRVIPLWKRGPVDPAAWLRLVRLIREERIDLVHTHLWGANLWGRLAAWWTGRPAAATEHSTDAWKPGYYFRLDRWLAGRTARLITVSDAVRRFYVGQGIPPAVCRTIPNGVDTAALQAPQRSVLYDELHWGAETPVFVVVGRLVEAKNLGLFIDAMGALLAERPQARGLIIGDGPLRTLLDGRIAARGLTGRVVLAGQRADVPAVLRGARAVVFTSSREGLPMALIEAMAAGVPVVSTSVGGIPEVLQDKHTGWLMPPAARDPLVERLRILTDDPNLARQVGAAAQADARQRWSVEVMVRRHEALYEEILAPPVRVVHVIDHLDSGGAQSQLLEVARHLPRPRWDVSVVSLSAIQEQLVPRFHEAGIDVTTIAQAGRWSWPCFFALWRHLRRLKPQIVHTWLFTADLYGRLAARAAGVPVVISAVRSVEPGKRPHYVWVDRGLQHLTDAITVNAQAVRGVLRQRERVREEKLHTIYNGIDLGVFSSEAVNGGTRQAFQLGTAPVVGLVSRLKDEKDPMTFVQAAGLVARALPQARFLLVGDGPMRGALEQEARRLGIAPQTVFAGFREDRAACLQAMDVVALSSLYEGCANAILEAMAMGKPVVATRVGGNPELVEDGRTGHLVPSRDPQAMARAILALLQDPSRAQAMGTAGRRRIEQEFTVDRMIARTETLYKQLLTRRCDR